MTILEAEKIRMPFGHYKDQTLGEIAAEDVLYLHWLAHHGRNDAYLAEAVGVLAEKHSDTIGRKVARGEKPKLFGVTPSSPARPRVIQQKLF